MCVRYVQIHHPPYSETSISLQIALYPVQYRFTRRSLLYIYILNEIWVFTLNYIYYILNEIYIYSNTVRWRFFGRAKRGVEVFALTCLYLTEWQKYIVYKTGSGLGPQSVRKSSIIEVRVIDSIHGPPPSGEFLSWEWYGVCCVWDLIIAPTWLEAMAPKLPSYQAKL